MIFDQNIQNLTGMPFLIMKKFNLSILQKTEESINFYLFFFVNLCLCICFQLSLFFANLSSPLTPEISRQRKGTWIFDEPYKQIDLRKISENILIFYFFFVIQHHSFLYIRLLQLLPCVSILSHANLILLLFSSQGFHSVSLLSVLCNSCLQCDQPIFTCIW